MKWLYTIVGVTLLFVEREILEHGTDFLLIVGFLWTWMMMFDIKDEIIKKLGK